MDKGLGNAKHFGFSIYFNFASRQMGRFTIPNHSANLILLVAIAKRWPHVAHSFHGFGK